MLLPLPAICGGGAGGFPEGAWLPLFRRGTGGGGEESQSRLDTRAHRRALIPQMSLCHLKGKMGQVLAREGVAGPTLGAFPERGAQIPAWAPRPAAPSPLPAGSGPSRSVTRACLCSSPDFSPGPPSLPTGPSRGAAPQPPPLGPRSSDRADPGGREEGETKARAGPASLRRPPCVSQRRGEDPSCARRNGEMPRLRPNPAAPHLDLWKVRVHVQRLRGGGRGLGDQLPRLEGPTPGGLSRRACFRYWWGPAGSWSSVHAAPPHPAWAQPLWDWSPLFCKELGGWEKPGVEE